MIRQLNKHIFIPNATCCTLNIYDVHFHITNKNRFECDAMFSGADSMSEILCFQLNKMKREKKHQLETCFDCLELNWFGLLNNEAIEDKYAVCEELMEFFSQNRDFFLRTNSIEVTKETIKKKTLLTKWKEKIQLILKSTIEMKSTKTFSLKSKLL